MANVTVNQKMLYCQKCQHEYEDNGQRFCVNDGQRLVPVGSSQKNASSGGVFSTILGDILELDRNSSRFAPASEFVRFETNKLESASVKPESFPAAIKEVEETAIEKPVSKPFSRIINPAEISSAQAASGSRETQPSEQREAVSREKPQVLIGQLVKGRYFITEQLRQNESSVTYLAEDKLTPGKKVFVCVLMEEDSDRNREFIEERVALSHINHPNINRVIDSGALPEGKAFIISEFIEGTPLKEILAQNAEFDVKRTARIIRQTAYALSEAFQNGVLHGNLSPEDIILSVNETGSEQVKVTNFSVSSGDLKSKNFWYKSPEHFAGNVSFASDIYSLAIIAYQMLTGRLPFNAAAAGEHLRLRREGMTLRPSNFRLDVSFSADEILEKALSVKPSDRYPKARDFGDALYNALTEAAENKSKSAEPENAGVEGGLIIDEQNDLLSVSNLFENKSKTEPQAEILNLSDSIQIAAPAAPMNANLFDKPGTIHEADEPSEQIRPPEDLAWQRRSTDPMKSVKSSWTVFAVLGIVLLFAGLWGVWAFFLNNANDPPSAPAVVENQPTAATENPSVPAPVQPETAIAEESEIPPPARIVESPPNSVYFENSKENTSKELLKSFRGFSLYYPNNWKKNKAENKFIDVSMDAPNGIPVEQIMISPYESKGTFSKDKELFPKLVEKSNKDLSKSLDGKYEVVSEGETTIQNGRWKAYEVKFRAEGNVSGEKTTVWGRRLWIPVQRPGASSGFIITMLATSYSNDIKSVEDVGVKGKLAEILYTFEPDTNL
jgi:eukaryotic-like serine/threonine-protein kinase